ncbi:SDR family oxidoreductase [Streptomyces sp. NPDC020951]|uniref:SDR family oxidoreductase n=1 Tax=Streptomyces sp. NPDC020951 TaxID=3365104 RepID=UPI0037A7F053
MPTCRSTPNPQPYGRTWKPSGTPDRLERLEELADELGLDRKAVVRTDVSDREQVKALVQRAVDLHGRIDVI